MVGRFPQIGDKMEELPHQVDMHNNVVLKVMFYYKENKITN